MRSPTWLGVGSEELEVLVFKPIPTLVTMCCTAVIRVVLQLFGGGRK